MARISKVTDSAKIVTDPELLRDLVRQGIDKDYVEFHEDYSTEHPGAKRYRDLKSGKRFMVVSGLPRVEGAGRKIEVGWLAEKGRYYAKANSFSAVVEGTEVQAGVKLDSVIWNPQLFLNGIELSCSKATLLETDPDNENYQNNVLEWDYGICKRRLRIIEGALLGRWVFPANPNGNIKIKYNQSGELKLNLGEFKVSDEEEFIPQSAFDEAKYPIVIEDSLTVYSAATDAYIYNTGAVYATVHDAADGGGTRPTRNYVRVHNSDEAGTYEIYRGYVFWDTSSLGAGAIISAAVASFYGDTGASEADATMADLGIVEATGIDSGGVVVGDYGDIETSTTLGASYHDVSASWDTAGYNDITLNATGRGWINKTGTTILAFRIRGDIDESTPTGANKVSFWANEKGSGFQPKLVITYTAPVEKTSSDSGSGSETLLSRAYVLPEVGTGSEALSSRLLGAVEQGAGAETLLARLLASTESASGMDAGGLIFTSSDVGSGSEVVLTLKALLTGTDSGSGIDTSFLIKALLSADSGLGTEAVAALLAIIIAGELMVGSDCFVAKIESAPTGGGMKLPPGGKTSISSGGKTSIPTRRVNL